jgi:hypothetical protein
VLFLASGNGWWSLQPVQKPALPRVENRTWARTAIDFFLLAAMEAKGLRPAPEAERLTLLRRVSFDLTGLPPSVEEQDAFLIDSRPDAYERVVERLLASPAYGERWGRHWLDVARYADTHGYDKDKRRDHAWQYRDWVIAALNGGLPYRDFVRAQLAGDVLHPDTREGLIATGFIAAGPWDFVGHVELREGTIDKMKTRVLDRDDMVSTALGAFASLTVGCARCHDHKFDPIPTADYYALQAVFAGVERGDRPLPPEEGWVRRRKQISEQLAQLQREMDRREGPDAAKRLALRALGAKLPALPGPSPTNGYHSRIEPRSDVIKWVQIDLGKPFALEEVRLWPARPTDFPDTPGFGFPVRFKIEASDDATFSKDMNILMDQTQADFPNPEDSPVLIPVKHVTARYVRLTATRLWKRTGDFALALGEMQVLSDGKVISAGKTVTARDSIDTGRWATRYLVDGHTSRAKLPEAGDAGLQQRLKLVRQIQEQEARRLASLPAEWLVKRQSLERERQNIEDQINNAAQVYAIRSIPPRPIHVLKRGDVQYPKDEAKPAALSCVSLPITFDSPTEGGRRLALADWLTHEANPLTWRSIVNRVWYYHFGRGLVDTPNDFGKMGSLPSHPELLDWLASDFRDQGGSLKQLHRQIVTSAVYRQSGQANPQATHQDSENRLLTSMPRRRLDAESLRDATLAVSGQLRPIAGGPGYALFRFKDDHSPTYDHTSLAHIHDPATYRRTVYRFVVRSVPNPFLDCLDGADPNQPVPVRNTTVTSLQALAMLNNPFMVRQAQHFAQRLQEAGSSPRDRAVLAHRLAFGTRPDADTLTALIAHAEKHGWPATCRVLLNANAFVFVD